VGNWVTFSYDVGDRLTAIADFIGPVASYSYDANSNKVGWTDGNGNLTTYGYDGLNRITTIQDPAGFFDLYFYDAQDNIDSHTDRNLISTSYTYDALDRNILINYPMGYSNSTAYDAVGNIASRTDGKGNTTSYSYDSNNRLITETLADGSTLQFTYDLAGNRTARTDNNGITTNYTYDSIDRLTLIDYPGLNDNTYGYDNEGNLSSAVNANAIVTYAYDNADRMISESLNGKSTTYFYDLINHKRTVTYPGGRMLDEFYDPRTRLTSVLEGPMTMAEFAYDNNDQLTARSLVNGVNSSYTYNSRNRITILEHVKGLPIAQYLYTYDNEGNILLEQKLHHSLNSQEYAYDGKYQLTNFKEGNALGGSIPAPHTTIQYIYDDAGNRQSVAENLSLTTYTSDNVNRYTLISGTPPVLPGYDLNGNLLSDGDHTYAYDYENRLISVDGGATSTYSYDALGRKVEKTAAGITEKYFYEGERVIEERNGIDSVVATNVYGIWLNDLVSSNRNGSDYYFCTNAAGSIESATDIAGNVVERYEYDAYGNPSFYNSAYLPIGGSTIGNTRLWGALPYEPEIEKFKPTYRLYLPSFGRFDQRDPLGTWADPVNSGNAHTYAGNNPVNWSDPSGKLTITGGKNGTKVTTPGGTEIVLKPGEEADVPSGSKIEDLPDPGKKEIPTPAPRPDPNPVPQGPKVKEQPKPTPKPHPNETRPQTGSGDRGNNARPTRPGRPQEKPDRKDEGKIDPTGGASTQPCPTEARPAMPGGPPGKETAKPQDKPKAGQGLGHGLGQGLGMKPPLGGLGKANEEIEKKKKEKQMRDDEEKRRKEQEEKEDDERARKKYASPLDTGNRF